MFADSLLPNLLLFAVGQVTAWGYLRTGLVNRGLALLLGAWVLVDIALLARFAFDAEGLGFRAPLLLMQLWSAGEFLLFLGLQVRRRLPGVRRRRAEQVRVAFLDYLRNDLESAEGHYRKMLLWDPWDLSARMGLASVRRATGRVRSARRLLRNGLGRARQERFEDVVRGELSDVG